MFHYTNKKFKYRNLTQSYGMSQIQCFQNFFKGTLDKMILTNQLLICKKPLQSKKLLPKTFQDK